MFLKNGGNLTLLDLNICYSEIKYFSALSNVVAQIYFWSTFYCYMYFPVLLNQE